MKLLYIPAQATGGFLELIWDDIANVPVTDAANLMNWNDFFRLPYHGNPFTSVSVYGNVVTLRGGSDIVIQPNTFAFNLNLIALTDYDGCIIEVGESAFFHCDHANLFAMSGLKTLTGVASFGYCGMVQVFDFPLLENTNIVSFQNCICYEFSFPSLRNVAVSCFQDCETTIFNLPNVTDILLYGFLRCNAMQICYIPSCIHLGATVGFDNVFAQITGNSITLTVPSALMTCNNGVPDGDIQNLQNNNTVTVVAV